MSQNAKYFVGIDPGKSGGLAQVAVNGSLITSAMPATEYDVLEWLLDAAGQGSPVKVMLERVRSSPQMGVTSAFTFGRSYGSLLMAVTAAGLPFDEVTPQVWQRRMGCLSGGDKNVTKRRAQALFPDHKITHAIADALLLAEYCRRLHQGYFAT